MIIELLTYVFNILLFVIIINLFLRLQTYVCEKINLNFYDILLKLYKKIKYK